MTPEQKAIVLDAAQEMQTNDEWWLEFEWSVENEGEWTICTATFNPLYHRNFTAYVFRRKPQTITVTIPVPCKAEAYVHSATGLLFWFKDSEKRDQALAAIKEAME